MAHSRRWWKHAQCRLGVAIQIGRRPRRRTMTPAAKRDKGDAAMKRRATVTMRLLANLAFALGVTGPPTPMVATASAQDASTPTGPGSVSGAPNLPAGFANTFKSRYVDIGGLRLHAVIG